VHVEQTPFASVLAERHHQCHLTTTRNSDSPNSTTSAA
jgi:hypothetical protein